MSKSENSDRAGALTPTRTADWQDELQANPKAATFAQKCEQFSGLFVTYKVLAMINSIRCGQCDRKLAEGRYLELSIKCPRCGKLNQYQSTPERQRAPNQGTPDGRISHHSVARRQTSNS